jgi:hypothetical protein
MSLIEHETTLESDTKSENSSCFLLHFVVGGSHKQKQENLFLIILTKQQTAFAFSFETDS